MENIIIENILEGMDDSDLVNVGLLKQVMSQVELKKVSLHVQDIPQESEHKEDYKEDHKEDFEEDIAEEEVLNSEKVNLKFEPSFIKKLFNKTVVEEVKPVELDEVNRLAAELIVRDAKINSLTDEIDEYKAKLESTKLSLREAQLKEASKLKCLGTLNAQMEQMKEEEQCNVSTINYLQSQVAYYQNKYSKIERIHQLYNNLSQQAKDGVAIVLRGISSVEGLMLCIGNHDNIRTLWEYVVHCYVSYLEIAEEVNALFDILFEQYAEVYPNYTRAEIEADTQFNEYEHIRLGPAGEIIKDVKFVGIVHAKTGHVIQKSLVTV